MRATVYMVSSPGAVINEPGYLALQINALGSTATTRLLKPLFPLKFREKLILTAELDCASNLTEVQHHLNEELLVVNLLQRNNSQGGLDGIALATFRTSVGELLFPSGSKRSFRIGGPVDLLMHSSKTFKGILPPKIELTTKLSIEGRVRRRHELCHLEFLNPEMIVSNKTGNGSSLSSRFLCTHQHRSPDQQNSVLSSMSESSIKPQYSSTCPKTCAPVAGGPHNNCYICLRYESTFTGSLSSEFGRCQRNLFCSRQLSETKSPLLITHLPVPKTHSKRSFGEPSTHLLQRHAFYSTLEKCYRHLYEKSALQK